MNMKKRICVLLMIAAAMWLLCGCGMMIVEDAEPVRIGMAESDTRLT